MFFYIHLTSVALHDLQLAKNNQLAPTMQNDYAHGNHTPSQVEPFPVENDHNSQTTTPSSAAFDDLF